MPLKQHEEVLGGRHSSPNKSFGVGLSAVGYFMKYLWTILLCIIVCIHAEVDIELWSPSFDYQYPTATLTKKPILGQITSNVGISNITAAIGTRKQQNNIETSIFYKEASSKKVAIFHATGNFNGDNNVLNITVTESDNKKTNFLYAIPISYRNNDFENFNLKKTIEVHTNSVNSLQFSLDCQYLVSSSNDCSVKVFDTNNFKEIQTIPMKEPIRRAILTSNNKNLIIGTKNGTLAIYNPLTGKKIYSFPKQNPIEAMALSPSQNLLAVADSVITIWNLETKQKVAELDDHSNILLTSLQFTPDEKYLIATNELGVILLWLLSNKSIKYRRTNGHNNKKITNISICPSYHYLYTSDQAGIIKWWKLLLDPNNYAWNSHGNKFWEMKLGFLRGNVKSFDITTNSNDIKNSIRKQSVFIIDNTDGDTSNPLSGFDRGYGGGISALQLNGTGEFLMYATLEGTLRIHETASFFTVYSHNLGKLIQSGTISDTGKYVALGGMNGEIWIYGK